MTGATKRLVRTAEIMGTVVSVHVILDRSTTGTSESDGVIAEPVERAFEQLREIDRIFSTYRATSDISRMRAGSLAENHADSRIAVVRRACERAEAATGELFSARWRGGFDPTGYVKGWAVERTFDQHLRPLLEDSGIVAIGMNAGGDMQLATHPDADWVWQVGIVNPARPGSLVATTALRSGAVATSGTAERGAHILDPRDGLPATRAVSATAISDRLIDADVWATAAVVGGIDDLDWVARSQPTSGMIIGHDGRVRRWAAGAEVSSRGPNAVDPSVDGGQP